MSSYEQGIIGFRRPITWEDSSSTKNSSATRSCFGLGS